MTPKQAKKYQEYLSYWSDRDDYIEPEDADERLDAVASVDTAPPISARKEKYGNNYAAFLAHKKLQENEKIKSGFVSNSI